MKTTVKFLHPGVEASAEAKPQMAARLDGLQGKRIAIMGNGKVNAENILRSAAKRLQALGAGEIRLWTKQHAAESGEKHFPALFGWKPDIALVAVGD